jgi:hypothetical protein
MKYLTVEPKLPNFSGADWLHGAANNLQYVQQLAVINITKPDKQ